MADRVFFDTEFIDDGVTIDLISIGMVREDGMEYYAEAVECDISRAGPWVRQNVFPGLSGKTKPRSEIAFDIVNFVGSSPEFWAWYASYDWVALCQLYGSMVDLPVHWPQYCMDVRWFYDERTTFLEKPRLSHNALDDAIWARDAWRSINEQRQSGMCLDRAANG